MGNVQLSVRILFDVRFKRRCLWSSGTNTRAGARAQED
jgi:hypothetical protein